MKVVIDTNILVMALSSKSPFHDIISKLKEGVYELVVTNDVLLEYEEIITIKYGEFSAKLFLILIDELPNVHFIRTYFHFNIIEQDPDDNKFIDASFAANARYLVTEDSHFKILKKVEYPQIDVIGIEEFLKILRG